MIAVVWFRQDLRCEDNSALKAGLEQGKVIPLFIWAPEEEGGWAPGGASRWWLHYSLLSLKEELELLGLTLIIRKGPSLPVLAEIAADSEVKNIFWNHRYEPLILNRDASIKAHLVGLGVNVQTFNSSLLFEPWSIANKKGKPFKVFTPFWKACLQDRGSVGCVTAITPTKLRAPRLASLSIADLDLLPSIPWDEGIKNNWQPGSRAAKKILDRFLSKSLTEYSLLRDRPDFSAVSYLSPYLHFGEISPRQIWQAIKERYPEGDPSCETYLRQIGWREFAYHLLFHFPHTTEQPLNPEFVHFPWNSQQEWLKAWQEGQTGYPIVDAGMRQLWHTGWMHNRVRLIVGSFLVKDLLLPWLDGAKWFWDTLVDADLANNTLGWQWVAGSGADAAPYFRIFNPILQGQKFDPEGNYIRKWVPELQKVPVRWIHRPWEAAENELSQAGVILGKNYPKPLVDHCQARQKALKALKAMRQHE